MDGGPGAARRSSAGGPPPGAVVVPVGAAAAAAPAAAGAGAAWARVSARVTWTGAAAPPPPAVAPAAAARAPPPPPPPWTRLSARLALAAALFLLGCAAAGLAFFAMILPAADSRLQVKACAPPADLRAASEYLLLAASAQVLAATMGLLVPARLLALFGCLLGWITAYRAAAVLWMLVVACHGSTTAHGALAFHFWLFFALLCVALVVGCVVSRR